MVPDHLQFTLSLSEEFINQIENTVSHRVWRIVNNIVSEENDKLLGSISVLAASNFTSPELKFDDQFQKVASPKKRTPVSSVSKISPRVKKGKAPNSALAAASSHVVAMNPAKPDVSSMMCMMKNMSTGEFDRKF